MRDLLDVILEGNDLSAEQASELMVRLTKADNDPVLVGALLAGLRAKGETSEEIRGLAHGMRGLARAPELDATDAVDVVGTGGDGSGSLNLSTGSALVAAAAGAPVVKHGNRSMSSRSGSADVLEALGLPMPLNESEAGRCFEATGFTFLFAPYYHPATGAVVPIRKALGVRTVFNMLGPLTNPGAPGYAVIGVWSLDAARLMAGALAGTEVKRAFVCHGTNGWDEPTPIGPFHLLDVHDGVVTESVRDPAALGLKPCTEDQLRGGMPNENASSLLEVFDGMEGPHRDALILGGSLALEVTGAAATQEEALDLARRSIDDGRARHLVDQLGSFRADG